MAHMVVRGAQLRPPCVRCSRFAFFPSYACRAPTSCAVRRYTPLGSRPYWGGQGTNGILRGTESWWYRLRRASGLQWGAQWSHGTAGTGGSVRTPSFSVPHFASPFASFSARLALTQFGVASSVCRVWTCIPPASPRARSHASRTNRQSSLLLAARGFATRQRRNQQRARRNNQCFLLHGCTSPSGTQSRSDM